MCASPLDPLRRAHLAHRRCAGCLLLCAVQLAIDREDLVKEANKEGFYTSLYDVKIDENKTMRVLPQRLQLHPTTNEVQHAWFLKYKEGGNVKVNLPVEINGRDKSAGLRFGGWLMTIRHKIECEVPFDDIPPTIPWDIASLHVGDCFRMRMVDWEGLGATPLRFDAHEPIAKIAGSRAARAALKATDGE